MVLVTNFRAFALIGKGPSGQPRILESFSLAGTKNDLFVDKIGGMPKKISPSINR
jgi:hypothetical protein